MNLLFGVQGTGNGHITRARAIAPVLEKLGIKAEYLFSGRKKAQFFDMEPFRDYKVANGLTFYSRKGKVQLGDTLLRNNMLRLTQDVASLDVSKYDFILTDFEPVSAWAGRLAEKDVIGLGHQYAFSYNIPRIKGTVVDQFILQNFAPADVSLGLHWHHFGAPVLPPIAPVGVDSYAPEHQRILVYLPFESRSDITRLLKDFKNYHFVLYHPEAGDYKKGNLEWKAPSRETFQQDLLRSEGVICNAGFELASEALQLGMKLLCKPMDGQPEQQSNALALGQLGFAGTMNTLNKDTVAQWLELGEAVKVHYPDTAQAVGEWIRDGASEPIIDLSRRLWREVIFPTTTAQFFADTTKLPSKKRWRSVGR